MPSARAPSAGAKLVVHPDPRGWHLEGPDALDVRCYSRIEAERIARDLMARTRGPIELLVIDAYHRVVRHERAGD